MNLKNRFFTITDVFSIEDGSLKDEHAIGTEREIVEMYLGHGYDTLKIQMPVWLGYADEKDSDINLRRLRRTSRLVAFHISEDEKDLILITMNTVYVLKAN